MRIACCWGPVVLVVSIMVMGFLVIDTDEKPGLGMLNRIPGGMCEVLSTWPLGGAKPALLSGWPTLRAFVAKGFHVVIFACWSFMLARALDSAFRFRMAAMFVAVLLGSFTLGLLTESAQAAGQERNGQMLDVGINAAGSVLGLGAFWFARSRGMRWITDC